MIFVDTPIAGPCCSRLGCASLLPSTVAKRRCSQVTEYLVVTGVVAVVHIQDGCQRQVYPASTGARDRPAARGKAAFHPLLSSALPMLGGRTLPEAVLTIHADLSHVQTAHTIPAHQPLGLHPGGFVGLLIPETLHWVSTVGPCGRVVVSCYILPVATWNAQ